MIVATISSVGGKCLKQERLKSAGRQPKDLFEPVCTAIPRLKAKVNFRQLLHLLATEDALQDMLQLLCQFCWKLEL